ncbi:MAG: LCP family protein [Eubacterium sp.]|nr:LCP family protein [Eubacterium sp.]
MGKKMLSDLNHDTGYYGYQSEGRIAPKNKKKKGGKKGSIFGVFLALIQLGASVFFISKVYTLLATPILAAVIGVLVVLFGISMFTQHGKKGTRTFGKIFSIFMTIVLITASLLSGKMLSYLNQFGGNIHVDTDTPFVVFLSASDQFGDYSQDTNYRSDTNIVAVVNPKTYTVLMVSTPRDYYVCVEADSVASGATSSYEKLTHVGLYGSGIAYDSNGKKLSASEWGTGYDVIAQGGKWGTSDMYGKNSKYNGFTAIMNTLKALYQIEIDDAHYSYLKMNFTGFGRLIDAMDGVTVDVDQSFSSRTYANYENDEGRTTYHFKKGKQEMNGSEALTYARERKKLGDGDMGRNRHQVAVMKAIANKMLSTSTYVQNNYTDIIEALGNSFSTNLNLPSLVKFQTAISTQGGYNGWNIVSYSVVGSPGKGTIMWDGTSKAIVEQDETSVANARNLIKMTLDGADTATIEKQIEAYNK